MLRFGLATRNNDTHCESENQVSSVCHWQHLQRKSRFIIQVWNATDKLSQTLPGHWFERVSLHHQCCEFYSTGYSRFNRENIWRWLQEKGVWGIALYQDFLKVITKAPPGSHSHGNMKQSEIFWKTEPTLNVASVTPHQLKNGTAPIMTWWLQGASFSVDIVLSAQHHQVCNKTNTILSTLGSVSA